MKPWKKVSETPLNVGHRTILKSVFEMPDGRIKEFELAKGGRVVCVLALTAEKSVVLVRQFRPGPEKVILDMPGGGVGMMEKPEDAIKRELLEETGYAGNFQFVGTSLHDAYSTRTNYNFVATDCVKVQEPAPDESEFIEVVEMPLEQFRQHLRSGELSDVATGFLGLCHLGLMK